MDNDRPQQDRDRVFIEVPPAPPSPYPPRVPSASDPMGEIYARGIAMRALGSGNVHWWVLISGWVIYGSIFLLFVSIAISMPSYGLIFPLALVSIPLIPLWKGTAKKLALGKRKSR